MRSVFLLTSVLAVGIALPRLHHATVRAPYQARSSNELTDAPKVKGNAVANASDNFVPKLPLKLLIKLPNEVIDEGGSAAYSNQSKHSLTGGQTSLDHADFSGRNADQTGLAATDASWNRRGFASAAALGDWVRVYGEANPHKAKEPLLDVEAHIEKIITGISENGIGMQITNERSTGKEKQRSVQTPKNPYELGGADLSSQAEENPYGTFEVATDGPSLSAETMGNQKEKANRADEVGSGTSIAQIFLESSTMAGKSKFDAEESATKIGTGAVKSYDSSYMFEEITPTTAEGGATAESVTKEQRASEKSTSALPEILTSVSVPEEITSLLGYEESTASQARGQKPENEAVKEESTLKITSEQEVYETTSAEIKNIVGTSKVVFSEYARPEASEVPAATELTTAEVKPEEAATTEENPEITVAGAGNSLGMTTAISEASYEGGPPETTKVQEGGSRERTALRMEGSTASMFSEKFKQVSEAITEASELEPEEAGVTSNTKQTLETAVSEEISPLENTGTILDGQASVTRIVFEGQASVTKSSVDAASTVTEKAKEEGQDITSLTPEDEEGHETKSTSSRPELEGGISVGATAPNGKESNFQDTESSETSETGGSDGMPFATTIAHAKASSPPAEAAGSYGEEAVSEQFTVAARTLPGETEAVSEEKTTVTTSKSEEGEETGAQRKGLTPQSTIDQVNGEVTTAVSFPEPGSYEETGSPRQSVKEPTTSANEGGAKKETESPNIYETTTEKPSVTRATGETIETSEFLAATETTSKEVTSEVAEQQSSTSIPKTEAFGEADKLGRVVHKHVGVDTALPTEGYGTGLTVSKDKSPSVQEKPAIGYDAASESDVYGSLPIEPSGYQENVPPGIITIDQKPIPPEQAVGYVGVPVFTNPGKIAKDPPSIDRLRAREFFSLPLKKVDDSTKRKWHPFEMDCSTEVDDKGDLCSDWAKGGLCLSHKPTMFLFCRRTCLCTGPPEDSQ